MTWAKAAPALLISFIFDALRFACDFLWFLGPIILGAGTSSAVSSATGSQAVGHAVGVITTGLSALGMPFFIALGTILSMVVGILGWFVLLFVIVLTNVRLVKDMFRNPAYFLLSLGITQVPFLNTIPSLTISTTRLYRQQMKKERAALAAWRSAQATQATGIAEAQALRAAQLRAAYEQELVDEEGYEIPESQPQNA